MASNLIRRLVAGRPVLLDGAWGTELQVRGLPVGQIPDGWNLSHPERVEEVARAYVEAGSQIILTNTFRANRITLGRVGGDSYVSEVNRAGVLISRRAAGPNASVFSSIGPTGKLLVAGDVQETELLEAFREQARAQAEAGADGIVIETMSDLAEAKAALAAARETGLPCVVCMVFDSGKKKDRTMMGVTPEQAARELTEAGADAIGANCGTGAESYVPVCSRLKAAAGVPIWIKPNAGLPEMIDGKAVYMTTPEQFAEAAAGLLAAGADFLGGCCGTNPDFIRALASRRR